MNVKNTAIIRAMIGFPLGMLVGFVLTAVSATVSFDDGTFYYCAPEFARAMGSGEAALLIQTLVTGFYGAFGMGASAMYVIEEWSLLRASLTHFLLTLGLMYPMAFFLRWWAPVPVSDNLIMLFFFVCVYVCIWFSQYFSLKIKVRRLNREFAEWKRAASERLMAG